MDIIQNLNKRLKLSDETIGYRKATDEDIKKLKTYAKIELPDDYIEFLRQIMGVGCNGLGFIIDDSIEFEFWPVDQILYQRTDFPFLEEKLPNGLIIGTDLGDNFLFYGQREEGIALYYVEDGCIGYEYATKIADSLVEFMVNGVGIDLCFQ